MTIDLNPLKGFTKNEKMGLIIFSIAILLQVITFSMGILILLNPGIVEGFKRLVDLGGPLGTLITALSLFISALLLLAMGFIAAMIGKYGIELSRHISPDGVGDE